MANAPPPGSIGPPWALALAGLLLVAWIAVELLAWRWRRAGRG